MKGGEMLQQLLVHFISPRSYRTRGHWLCGAPLKPCIFRNEAAGLPVWHLDENKYWKYVVSEI